ncbi:class I SAM-dependent methyltransferase [Actinacidiphila guanduensis]|uniref:Methyltransferase domain-containing protein n=1 Tax=Actinacidiphila guanduensis TaxID=310781 RepID=A0A1H0HL28_9ACTN|nr:class I SAM-dependent methyltransferase [Actinacidiphila guanduensis]SDO19916.1 Methyltransferase domain-containing protein [Actinacidiphila guanduensis]
MTLPKYHLDRARAQSFGSDSEQYDRYRPSPPDALVDDLVALRAVDVLDVGCGTGKVAVALAGRGMRVLGVEVDGRMADVTRAHGVPVEVASFESWDAAGRRFDLITCSDAWHWIDPVVGSEKAAALLRPGGTLALFWSSYLLEASVEAVFQRIYDEHAPKARTHSYEPLQARSEPFEPIAAFGPVETRTYRWDTTVSATEWVGLLATFSDHRALAPENLTALQAALYEAIEDVGGSMAVSRGVHAAFARRL